MNDDISPVPSMPHGVITILHRGWSAIITIVGVFVISGVLLVANGFGPSSEGSDGPAGAKAGATVDQSPSIKSSGTPTTNPSAIQYTSGVDPGQALVSGTSTLHDWTVKSIVIKGGAEFSGQWKAGSTPPTLQSIDLIIPGDSLKSTEGSGMDNTMYDALKAKQFSNITYKLTKASLKSPPSRQDSAYHFDAIGQLTVAGATHPVSLDLGVLPHDDGPLTVTTDLKLKMTDFGIKPPTAMMGVIKSGDAITVKVRWQLSAKAPPAKADK